jgi:hypothetical protein
MRTNSPRTAPFLLLASLLACRQVPATQLVVVVDTNLTPMQGLENVRVTLQAPEGTTLSERIFDVAPVGPVALPFSFGVVPENNDPNRRVRVIAQARTGRQTVLVQRSALTGFVEGRVLRLPLFLPDTCLGLDCPTGTTCRGDAPVCVSDTVEPARLAESPTSPRGEFDGGATLPLSDGAVVEGSVRDLPVVTTDAAPDVTAPDAAAPDAAAPDAAAPDAAAPDATAPDAAALDAGASPEVRPQWPLSMGRVTRLRPTLRFTLGRAARVRVELCRNRTCGPATDGGPGGVIESIETTLTTAVPPAPLPARATVFWRVTPIDAAGAATGSPSPVWYFRTPATDREADTSHLAQTDANGDGLADLGYQATLASGERSWRLLSGPSLSASPMTLAEVTQPNVCAPCGGDPIASASGDFTGDGTSDLLLGCCGSLSVRVIGPSLTTSTVTLSVTPGSTVNAARFVGDLNRDGFGDIAAIVSNAGQSALKVYYGSPTGMGGSVASSPAGTTPFDAILGGAADIDGDGFNDLVVAASPGLVLAYRGGSSGVNLSAPLRMVTAATATDAAQGVSMRAGDHNGDGRSDVAYITGMRSDQTAQTAMYTLIWGDAMSGIRGSFSSLRTPVLPGRLWTTYLLAMTGGDLNGDGFDDFLWPQRDNAATPFTWTILSDAGEAGLMFNRREVFAAAPGVPASDGLLPGGASPGDVDGDGFDDVALSKGIAAGGSSVPGYLLVRGGSTATVVLQPLSPAAAPRTGGVFE